MLFYFAPQHNCVKLPDTIPKLVLEDIRSVNDDTYNLTGFISKNGSEHVPIVRCGDNDEW